MNKTIENYRVLRDETKTNYTTTDVYEFFVNMYLFI